MSSNFDSFRLYCKTMGTTSKAELEEERPVMPDSRCKVATPFGDQSEPIAP